MRCVSIGRRAARRPRCASDRIGADIASAMDILFLLVPFSVLLVLALIGLFAWAIQSNQFDDLQREGERILEGDAPEFDADQGPP
jgi:cbb3-type cytochrome oxidase maturation protein